MVTFGPQVEGEVSGETALPSSLIRNDSNGSWGAFSIVAVSCPVVLLALMPAMRRTETPCSAERAVEEQAVELARFGVVAFRLRQVDAALQASLPAAPAFRVRRCRVASRPGRRSLRASGSGTALLRRSRAPARRPDSAPFPAAATASPSSRSTGRRRRPVRTAPPLRPSPATASRCSSSPLRSRPSVRTARWRSLPDSAALRQVADDFLRAGEEGRRREGRREHVVFVFRRFFFVRSRRGASSRRRDGNGSTSASSADARLGRGTRRLHLLGRRSPSKKRRSLPRRQAATELRERGS